MAYVNFLHFDKSLLLLTVNLQGYLISIAYVSFFILKKKISRRKNSMKNYPVYNELKDSMMGISLGQGNRQPSASFLISQDSTSYENNLKRSLGFLSQIG